ncbi:MAG: hypothetical protein K8W52_43085 [Deltaproteobacteria bacterium]|nr:hypothetical protein [Deltaproteobacteria bacterium]
MKKLGIALFIAATALAGCGGKSKTAAAPTPGSDTGSAGGATYGAPAGGATYGGGAEAPAAPPAE